MVFEVSSFNAVALSSSLNASENMRINSSGFLRNEIKCIYILNQVMECVKGYEDNIFKKIKFNISIEIRTLFMYVLVRGMEESRAVFHKNNEVDRFHVPVSKVPVSAS